MITKRRLVFGMTLVAIASATISVFQWGPSEAQFAGGGGTVEVSNTVQTETRITGQTVTLDVQGTVALDGASLDTLNEPQCPPLSMGHAGVDGTVRLVPPSADPGRTRLLVVNHSNSGYLSCRTGPSSGFVSPVCTLAAAGVAEQGARLDPSSSMTLDITSADILRCINCTNVGAASGATAQVSFVELNCI